MVVICGPSDRLAVDFCRAATAHGRRAERWTCAEAASRLTIARAGCRATVRPHVPLLLRYAEMPWQSPTAEQRFHFSEMWSLVWAAAAITSATVINRPGSQGLIAAVSPSSAVLRRRAHVRSDECEVFASHEPKPRGPSHEWWLQPLRPGSPTEPGDGSEATSPVRAGHIPEELVARSVTVVGGAVFPASDQSASRDGRLHRLSREVCSALGLLFASVTWGVTPTGEAVRLGRVSPCPTLEDVGPAWPEIARSLLDLLEG